MKNTILIILLLVFAMACGVNTDTVKITKGGKTIFYGSTDSLDKHFTSYASWCQSQSGDVLIDQNMMVDSISAVTYIAITDSMFKSSVIKRIPYKDEKTGAWYVLFYKTVNVSPTPLGWINYMNDKK